MEIMLSLLNTLQEKKKKKKKEFHSIKTELHEGFVGILGKSDVCGTVRTQLFRAKSGTRVIHLSPSWPALSCTTVGKLVGKYESSRSPTTIKDTCTAWLYTKNLAKNISMNHCLLGNAVSAGSNLERST